MAIYGYNAIHAFERYAGIALAAGFALIAIGTLTRAHLGAPFDPHAPVAGGGEIAGIVFSAALAFSYAIGWGPAASDYARYLPEKSSPRAVSAWAALGGFIPSTLLELLGAAAVTAVRGPGIAGATPADTIVLLFGGGPLATIGLITVLIGTISANCLNLYSGALSALVAWDARRRPAFALATGASIALLAAALLLAARANDPTARFAPWIVALTALAVGCLAAAVVRWTLLRWQSALAVGVLGGALALAGSDPTGTAHLYTNFLSLLSIWAAPWAAVLLATRGSTVARDECASAHRLGRRDRGVAAVLAAVLVHRTTGRGAPAARRRQLLRRLCRRLRARKGKRATVRADGAMTHIAIRTAAIAALAFGAGLAVAHVPQTASAAMPPLQPAVIDLAAITPADLPPPSAASPNLRAKTLAVADGATAAIQIGTVIKHYHADANEIQYVISGSGTEWLGDKQIPLHAGMLLIIPMGTPHAGTTDANLKILAIKTPPQAPTDVHPVP